MDKNMLKLMIVIVLLSSLVFAGHVEWYAQTNCYEESRPNIEHCQKQYSTLRQAHYDECVNPSSSDCSDYCRQFIPDHEWECSVNVVMNCLLHILDI